MDDQASKSKANKCEEEEVPRKANQANNKATPLGQI
jgi:hypothetical protein